MAAVLSSEQATNVIRMIANPRLLFTGCKLLRRVGMHKPLFRSPDRFIYDAVLSNTTAMQVVLECVVERCSPRSDEISILGRMGPIPWLAARCGYCGLQIGRKARFFTDHKVERRGGDHCIFTTTALGLGIVAPKARKIVRGSMR